MMRGSVSDRGSVALRQYGPLGACLQYPLCVICVCVRTHVNVCLCEFVCVCVISVAVT